MSALYLTIQTITPALRMFSKVTTPTGAQVTTFARFSCKEDSGHSHSLSLSLNLMRSPLYTQLTLAVVPDRMDFPSSHALICR